MTRPLFKSPNDWRVGTLEVNKEGGVIIEVGSGSTPPTDMKEYWDGHYPWLTPKEMTSPQCNRYIRMTERSVTEDGLKHAGNSWPRGTVMLTKRAPVGAVAFNDVPMAINQGILAFRCGKDILPDFLFYWFKVNGQYLDTVANGSTYPELYPGDLFEFEIGLPSIEEQRVIVNILKTFDDKIELNRQMNITLEKIGQTIFKAWFIDFDPVHANAKDDPVGLPADVAALFPSEINIVDGFQVPKEWKICKLPEVFHINPKRSLKKNQVAPYLDMQNVPTFGHRPISWIDRAFGSGTKFINGDTLLARITPCLEHGKTIFVDFLNHGQVGWGSTEYIILRPKDPIPPEYGYFLARSSEFREFATLNMTGSSGRLRVPSECFDQYRIVIPPKELFEKFGAIAQNILKLIKQFDEENQKLSALRDLMIPNLISGNIRISEEKPSKEVAT